MVGRMTVKRAVFSYSLFFGCRLIHSNYTITNFQFTLADPRVLLWAGMTATGLETSLARMACVMRGVRWKDGICGRPRIRIGSRGLGAPATASLPIRRCQSQKLEYSWAAFTAADVKQGFGSFGDRGRAPRDPARRPRIYGRLDGMVLARLSFSRR